MSEFESKVLERLSSIEAKAENYITWKTVAFGLVGGALLLIGYGEWAFSRIDSRFEERIAEATEAIEQKFSSVSGEAEQRVLAAIRNQSFSALASEPLTIDFSTTSGREWVSSAMFDGTGTPIIRYYDPAAAQEISDLWMKTLGAVGATAEPKTYALDELFIRNAEGDFVPAFETSQ